MNLAPPALRPADSNTRISYFGPENTNTHAAAIRLFGTAALFTPTLTKTAVFEAVSKGEADYGVVPIENSTEGVVRETVDCLISRTPSIRYEFEMDIEHCLMAQPGWDGKTRRIVSHPQPLAQCRKWLDAQFPQIPRQTAASTASAAALAAQDRSVAAIASRLAAQANGLTILFDNIADRKDNATRFICIAMHDAPPSGDDKTSLVFTAPHEQGALLKVLSVFGDAGVNLTRIESRPLPYHKWEYAFAVDLQGHRLLPPVAPAIAKLEELGCLLRIFGSYPRLNTSVSDESSADR